MTPTRRTRKSTALSNTNTSKPSSSPTSAKKKPNNNKSNQYTSSDEEEEEEEESSSDAGSVTRCICGEAHNLGLMVQCDKCEVWQHCECIGLIQDKLPDQYYCDQCQPENHQIIKTSSGRAKRLYLVDNKSNQNGSPSNSPQMHSDKRPTKRRKKTDSPTNEQTSPTTASPQVEPLVDEVVATTSTRSTRRNTNKEDLVLFEDVISNKKPAKSHTPTLAAASMSKKEESPTTTTSNHNEPYWNYADGKPTRASSPPAKVKYPNTKMTFSDMNKRAKQIMDCISKWQPASSPAQLSHASLLLFESQYSRPRSLSTSSSSSSSCLSNASTVPLLLDDYTSTEASSPCTPIPYLQQQQQAQKQPHEETSLDILERINQQVQKFQRKFGIMYQEPKVTKSTTTA